MLINSSTEAFQPNLFGNDLLQQLDPADPLAPIISGNSLAGFRTGLQETLHSRPWRTGKTDPADGGVAAPEAAGKLKRRKFGRAVEAQSVLPVVLWYDRVPPPDNPATVPSWFISESVLARKGWRGYSR
jgi:hypothetical protein